MHRDAYISFCKMRIIYKSHVSNKSESSYFFSLPRQARVCIPPPQAVPLPLGKGG